MDRNLDIFKPEDPEWLDLSYDETEAMEKLGWLNHRPGPGYPRPDCMEEAVMANAWERYMLSSTIPNLKLCYITQAVTGLPDQSTATLFASIFTWFGTNCGAAFISDSERLSGHFKMVQQWGIENVRLSWINNGHSVLDSIGRTIGWKPSDFTADHFRLTNQLMHFFDGEEGQKLIHYARSRRTRALKIRHRKMRNHFAFQHGYPMKAKHNISA